MKDPSNCSKSRLYYTMLHTGAAPAGLGHHFISDMIDADGGPLTTT